MQFSESVNVRATLRLSSCHILSHTSGLFPRGFPINILYKVKSSEHAVKTYRVVKVRLYPFLALALDGVWSVPPTGRFITGESVPGTQWIREGREASEPIWGALEKSLSPLPGIEQRTLGFPVRSPGASQNSICIYYFPHSNHMPNPLQNAWFVWPFHDLVQQVVLKGSELVEKSFCSCVTRTSIAFITEVCTRQYWAMSWSSRVGGPGERIFGRAPRPVPGILPVLNGGYWWCSTSGKCPPWRAKQGNCTVTLIRTRYRAMLETNLDADDADGEPRLQPSRSHRVHSMWFSWEPCERYLFHVLVTSHSQPGLLTSSCLTAFCRDNWKPESMWRNLAHMSSWKSTSGTKLEQPIDVCCLQFWLLSGHNYGSAGILLARETTYEM